MYKEQNKSFHYGIILIVNCSKICIAKVQYFSQSTKKNINFAKFFDKITLFNKYFL